MGGASCVSAPWDRTSRRYPAYRFRVGDEQGRLRRHVSLFVAAGQIFDVAHPLRGKDTLIILQALSSG